MNELIKDNTKQKVEAMAIQYMQDAFKEFDTEYRNAIAKKHPLVVKQAEEKVAAKWKTAIRMSLICLDATDSAIKDYQDGKS